MRLFFRSFRYVLTTKEPHPRAPLPASAARASLFLTILGTVLVGFEQYKWALIAIWLIVLLDCFPYPKERTE